jgi:signal peptidase I
MYPFLRTGDRLLVEREIHTPVRIGQILIFRENHSSAGHTYTAHRVVKKIGNDRFITKGDNLFKPDPGIRSIREAAGIAVMLIRGQRLIHIKKGLYFRIGKLFAYLSRKNFTPGLLMARIKRIPGLLS